MLGPLWWSMPKITKSDAKLSEITNKTSGTFCSGQCNLRFLSTIVLQGTVATCVNYGRIFIDFFTANLVQSVIVKEFWKSVSISHSYRQKSGIFFSGLGVLSSQRSAWACSGRRCASYKPTQPGHPSVVFRQSACRWTCHKPSGRLPLHSMLTNSHFL